TQAEYVRIAENERTEKMGGDASEAAIEEATKAVKGAKTKDEAEAMIERLKKKHTTKPARKVLSALQKAIKKAEEFNRLKILTREGMTEIIGKELGIGG